MEDSFLLLACDGLWSTMQYQEVADEVTKQLHQGKDPSAICEHLITVGKASGKGGELVVMARTRTPSQRTTVMVVVEMVEMIAVMLKNWDWLLVVALVLVVVVGLSKPKPNNGSATIT